VEESASVCDYPCTLFDDCLKWLRVPASIGMLVVAATGVFALVAATYLDGIVSRILTTDFLRLLLLQPTVSWYILLLQYFLRPSRVAVIDAFRPLIRMDLQEYNRLLVRVSPLTRRGELIALAIGLVVGIVAPLEWMVPDQFRWTNLYLTISTWILFAMVVWGAYGSLAVTRLFTRLHHQKLEIDLFHTTFVDVIARRSLALAIAYVGAIALSVFFFPPQTFRNIFYLSIVYAILILLSGFIFVFSMSETHDLLAEMKRREFEIVRRHLSEDYVRLKEHTDVNLANWVSAWLAYEKRIQDVPEWAFNPGTIRSLIASTLVPIGTVLARVLAERF
jgi:hypothetical protein